MSLAKFALKRLLFIPPILLGVSIITFALVYLTPGDPVDIVIGLDPHATEADYRAIEREFGFDQPVYVQYLDWLWNTLQGDFGIQYSTRRPVAPTIWDRVPPTIALGLFGWLFALVIAIPAGIYAAVRKDRVGDHVSRFVALSGVSIPNFYLGILMILLLSVWLDLWPTTAPRGALYSPEMLWYLLLPGLTIGTGASATLMRIMRSSMVEELERDYVMAARAKGLPERTVILKHVLRNSLISVVTAATLLTVFILAGSVVVETVFNWPGLGFELIGAVLQREMNMILAITLFTGIAIVIANLVADVLYAALDPRIRY